MDCIPTSYPNISKDKALELTAELCKIFYESGIEGDVVTLYKAGKQLTSLFFDCKPSRLELSEVLIEMQFLEFAVKLMKRLNNIGVFKDDNVWFASFYLYNICWNYSEINQIFASGLVAGGIQQLLISNILHDPYIENLSKANVNYLLKATLSIVHNILRVPGNRTYFSSESLIKGLLNISTKDDKLAVLCTLCLSLIACNENIEPSADFDIFYNVKLIFYYVKNATESGGKFNGYHLCEFFEVLKLASLSRIQRDAIVKLDGLDVMVEIMRTWKDDRVKAEMLLTMVNLLDGNKARPKITEVAKFYGASKSDLIRRSVRTLSWAIELRDSATSGDVERASTEQEQGHVVIVFAQHDVDAAERIFDRLGGDVPKLPLFCCELDSDVLRTSLDSASAVIVCLSEAFRSTVQLRVAADHCLWRQKAVFPVLIQHSYRPEGWVKDFIVQVSDVWYDFSGDLDCEWTKFSVGLRAQLDEATKARDVAMALVESGGKAHGASPEVVVKSGEDGSSSGDEVSCWLAKQNILDLLPKLDGINLTMLDYMKKIRLEAPEFYFRSLENNLKLSFVEIVKLSAALDNL